MKTKFKHKSKVVKTFLKIGQICKQRLESRPSESPPGVCSILFFKNKTILVLLSFNSLKSINDRNSQKLSFDSLILKIPFILI